jgi:hypothetical protein
MESKHGLICKSRCSFQWQQANHTQARAFSNDFQNLLTTQFTNSWIESSPIAISLIADCYYHCNKTTQRREKYKSMKMCSDSGNNLKLQ